MLRYQRGNREAFEQLVRLHQGRVYNFILLTVRNRTAADELAQDVFVRIVRTATQYRHDERFVKWLFSIVRAVCEEYSERSSNTSLSDDTEGVPPSEGDPVRASVLDVVSELPRDQREVYLLREVANLPFVDIAALTETPEIDVTARMRTALRRVQDALSGHEEFSRALR